MKISTKIKAWLHDYVYMIHGVVTGLTYIAPPSPKTNNNLTQKNPLIILPGIFNKWGIMKKLVDTLHNEGHPIYVVPKLGFNMHTIAHSSQLVAEIIREENLKNVIFVAHSKGGLIGKYFLMHHNSNNNAIGLISIATPYSGSSMGKLVPLLAVRELSEDSSVIKDVMSKSDVNSKIVSIYPEYDNHVWSEQGSYLEGAKNVPVSVHGHHKIVFDPEVIALVLSSIEEMRAVNSVD